MNGINLTSKSDIIGAMAGTLCFLHCLATPLLFAAYSSTAIVEKVHPWWWGILDLVFLAVSFFAVYWSAKNTSKRWIKYVLWCLWVVLTFLIFNEKWGIVTIADETIYFPTVGLTLLHFYNRNYCHCEDDNCCVDTK